MSKLYENPLVTRYASKEMLYVFSPDFKFSTWRRLWVALAKGEKDLGISITDEQIEELENNIDNIDYEKVSIYERQTRHDVMSHVKAYGDVCPKARGIIHLGATSAYVGDNTDIIQYKEALNIVLDKLIILMSNLKEFAEKYKSLPTLGFTHFQPAQLTTVGKRACLWLMDLLMDYETIVFLLENTRFRGVKGTTGTQASFMSLFDNDSSKVELLDKYVSSYMGFDKTYPVTGQTYSRKYDYNVTSALSGLCQSMHKMTNDIRLLQHLKEIEEPFEKDQIGSSAMAYKRNPMRSERIASLCRLVISLTNSTANTAATQWFERTLDDSANKRIAIPEAFLAVDSILSIAINVTGNLVVYDKIINKNLMAELPFMATENILMEAVKKGGDRQELHERIREHSMEAGKNVKELGLENDLLDRLAKDSLFMLDKEEILQILKPENYTGRSEEQVTSFLRDYIEPITKEIKNYEINIKV